MANHERISARDKDMEPVFAKLCGLACFELFICQNDVPELYTEEECEEMKEQVDLIREDQFLDDVFGYDSTLDNALWLEKMCKEAAWVFDSAQLRKRLLEAASIEEKHV